MSDHPPIEKLKDFIANLRAAAVVYLDESAEELLAIVRQHEANRLTTGSVDYKTEPMGDASTRKDEGNITGASTGLDSPGNTSGYPVESIEQFVLEAGFTPPTDRTVPDPHIVELIQIWDSMQRRCSECSEEQASVSPALGSERPAETKIAHEDEVVQREISVLTYQQQDEYPAFQEAMKVFGGPDDGPFHHADEGALYWLWGKAVEWANKPGSSGWEPIETAPRDNREVLVYDEVDDHVFSAWWVRERWENTWDGEILSDLTHWMPMPMPPKKGD